MLTKQAKTLSTQQINKMLEHLSGTRYPTRNRVCFLASVFGGMRSKEISELKWGMAQDPEGNFSDSIHLPNNASKGKSGGRVIPLHPSLRAALELLKDEQERTEPDHYVIQTAQNSHPTAATITQMFQTWYKRLGFSGCSSHSGRRTFGTRAAQQIVKAGGTLLDVKMLLGHSSIQCTMRYIDQDSDAARKAVLMM